MKIRFLSLIILILLPHLSYSQIAEESDALRKSAIKVFIDCNRCDMNYIREEIPYVNYVRDVKEAQIYILETSQSTGSGGTAYTFTFNDQYFKVGTTDTLVYNSRPDDPSDLTRDGRTKMLQMGLMRYVALTPLFRMVDISSLDNYKTEEVTDNWNNWVFEIQIEPSFDLKESRRKSSFNSSFDIYRITPKWKMEFGFDQNFNMDRSITLDTTYYKRSMEQKNLIVRSISDHWSVGARLNYSTSLFGNINASFDFIPAIEYNIYPYYESTRRQLRINYGMGYSFNDYIGTTVYDKDVEHLIEQKLSVAYRVQQKWGSINVSINSSNYMHDISLYRVQLGGSMRIRITKGLSVSMRGNAAKINNQISLPKGDLDPADILLDLKEQKTAYSLNGGFGLTYTFGSIYNNVVNPRFGN